MEKNSLCTYLVLKQGRGLIFIGSNSKSQIDFINPWKSKDIYVPHALENSLMMFDSQNYEGLFPREQRLFSRPFWPYSLHTFSLVSLVKKYATCKAKMAFKKPLFTGI